WEMIEVLGHALDRVYVQVGGGALATCVGQAGSDEGVHPALIAVQTQSCAPLERAWRRSRTIGLPAAAKAWSSCMQAWDEPARSAATGILDDETYDWLGVVQAIDGSGGTVVVVPETAVLEANDLGRRTTGIDVDATGTAGLAG